MGHSTTDVSLLRMAKALETIAALLQQAMDDEQTWNAKMAQNGAAAVSTAPREGEQG